jgi:hypothetical protein
MRRDDKSPLLVIYTRCLALYPRHFYQRYAGQMTLVAVQARREWIVAGSDHPVSSRGIALFWWRMFLDLFQSAAKEWVHMGRRVISERSIAFHAVALGVLFTLIGGAASLVVQQMLRRGADQPQRQMASEAADRLGRGEEPAHVVPNTQIDLRSNLAPFLLYFNEQKRPLAGNGYLDQSLPSPPTGVFDVARIRASHAVTWQPRPQVRIAAVIMPINGGRSGYVLAGRSLETTERYEAIFWRMAFSGWVAVMLLLAVGAMLLKRSGRGVQAAA